MMHGLSRDTRRTLKRLLRRKRHSELNIVSMIDILTVLIFFLLVNAAVGGVASQPPDRSTRLPQTMLIDYIRHYAPPGPRAGG